MAGALSGPTVAQAHPDFSGVWSPVAIRPAPPGGATSLPPTDLTIRQTATALAISRTAFENVITATQDLDGRESTNKSGAMTLVTTAHWDKARLVVEGKASQVTSQGYAGWKLKEIYSLNPKGHLLIDREWIGDDGTVTKSVQELARKAK